MRRFPSQLIQSLLIFVFIILTNSHWQNFNLPGYWQGPFNALSFTYLAFVVFLPYLNKPYTYRKTNKLKTCVVITVYNEDPETFKQALVSLDKQTLKPGVVHIVDDHSSNKDCYKIYKEWKKNTSIKAIYSYQDENAGKREAQVVAFRANTDAEIFITIDSDTVLDKNAIKSGLRPFGDEKVMSVAGMLIGLNNRHNFLTRLVDLGFVTSFINGRAAWSAVKSVAVNCGGLAFYRSSVIHKNIDAYLNMKVMGKVVRSGDDRVLTNYALLDGYTVFQETSIGYTLLPTNINHLTRQRIRWWRSFFWGGIWLIRRFPTDRLVWWLVVWQFYSFIFYTAIFISVITSSVSRGQLPIGFILYLACVLSYVRAARYLSVKDPRLSMKQRLVTFALAPISTLLHVYLCSILQYVGLATVSKTGWSTRNTVEVGLSSA